jgi:hypothetical protein
MLVISMVEVFKRQRAAKSIDWGFPSILQRDGLAMHL